MFCESFNETSAGLCLFESIKTYVFLAVLLVRLIRNDKSVQGGEKKLIERKKE